MSGQPDPKSRSLARGERRYRRKVASPKQWQAILAAKTEPCRVCKVLSLDTNGGFRPSHEPLQFHHIVPRSQGGDDVENNIVALCLLHHERVTRRARIASLALAKSLTDAEYAYVVGKLGSGGMERLFGGGVSPVWNWNGDPIRYDDPDAPISSGATTRERPAIRSVEDVWCWANTWGNERARDFSTRGERDAYRQCIRDVMVALAAAGIDFDAVPDEAWERWSRA